MSFTQDHGDFIIQCDGARCHEAIETHTSNFGSVLNIMRRNRWVARKNDDEWRHFCPACRPASAPKGVTRDDRRSW